MTHRVRCLSCCWTSCVLVGVSDVLLSQKVADEVAIWRQRALRAEAQAERVEERLAKALVKIDKLSGTRSPRASAGAAPRTPADVAERIPQPRSTRAHTQHTPLAGSRRSHRGHRPTSWSPPAPHAACPVSSCRMSPTTSVSSSSGRPRMGASRSSTSPSPAGAATRRSPRSAPRSARPGLRSVWPAAPPTPPTRHTTGVAAGNRTPRHYAIRTPGRRSGPPPHDHRRPRTTNKQVNGCPIRSRDGDPS